MGRSVNLGTGVRFPFCLNPVGRMNKIWTKHAYRFISNVFSKWAMDPSIQPDKRGHFPILVDPDGNNCRFPVLPRSAWSGIVFFEGLLKWDFNRVGNLPTGEYSQYGMYGVSDTAYEGSVTGEWIKISKTTGEFQFVDSDADGFMSDTGSYEYYPVARKATPQLVEDQYTMAFDRVAGDIRAGVSGGSSFSYKSYFKVYDASTELGCKVGVTDGGVANPDICGSVRINGVQVEIDPWESSLASDGTYWVWLHMWISVYGEHAEIRKGAVNVDDPPYNPNGGLAFSSQLLGRITVDDGVVTLTNQDYLRGGEHSEILWGDCNGFAVPT